MVRPGDLNTFQSVFGGFIIARVDALACGLVADLAGRTVVTAALDRLTFRAGIGAYQRMRLEAQANRTFRTSMEVTVAVSGEDGLTGRRWPTAEATLTVVGLDDGGRPTALPQVVPASPAERLAFDEAGLRRRQRLAAPAPEFAPASPPGPEDAARLAWEGTARIVRGGSTGGSTQASAGWLLALADELAAISASRHAGMPAVTAAVDGVSFLRPVAVGDVVTLRAYLVATFRTSMEIRVDIWCRPRYGRDAAPVAAAAFTYVGLGADGRPAPVPAFTPRGAREEALAEQARVRRAQRG